MLLTPRMVCNEVDMLESCSHSIENHIHKLSVYKTDVSKYAEAEASFAVITAGKTAKENHCLC